MRLMGCEILADPEVHKKLNLSYRPQVSVSHKDPESFRAFGLMMSEKAEIIQSMKEHVALSGSPGTNLARPLHVERTHPRSNIMNIAKNVDRGTVVEASGILSNVNGTGQQGALRPTATDLAAVDLALCSLGLPPEGFEWHDYLKKETFLASRVCAAWKSLIVLLNKNSWKRLQPWVLLSFRPLLNLALLFRGSLLGLPRAWASICCFGPRIRSHEIPV